MEDFELLKRVTIGQYLPTGSIIHRLDPRVKILGVGALAITLIAIQSASGVVVALLIVLGLIARARIDLRFALRGLEPALPLLTLLAILQLGFSWNARASNCYTLTSFWIVNVTTCSAQAVIIMLARIVAMVLLTGLLTFTSTLTELTRGIEWLLRPLTRIGVPADEIAMMFTIALRFVPTLALEMEKILKAQAARGAILASGSNPIARTRQMFPILIPLFINTLRRGDDLTIALEARGYRGGGGRTHYVRLHWQRVDALALGALALLILGLLALPFGWFDQTFADWFLQIIQK